MTNDKLFRMGGLLVWAIAFELGQIDGVQLAPEQLVREHIPQTQKTALVSEEESQEACAVPRHITDEATKDISNKMVTAIEGRLKNRTDPQYDPARRPFSNPPPTECGPRAQFVSTNAPSSAPIPDLEIADGVMLKFRRPDLLCAMRRAMDELERHHSFETADASNYCNVFDACKDPNMQKISQHSQVYNPCPKRLKDLYLYTRTGASPLNAKGRNMETQLPGFLGEQKDDNVFCSLSEYITNGITQQVLPMFNLTQNHCTTRELLINRLHAGAFSNPHRHTADFLGAVYYLDAPPDTRLCYQNSHGSKAKDTWQHHAKGWTPDFGGGQPFSARAAHVQPGDILLGPVHWLEHWVPPLLTRNMTRTSVLFAINCIRHKGQDEQ